MEQPTEQPDAAQGMSLVSIVLYVCLLVMTVSISAYLWVNKPVSTAPSTAAPAMKTYTDSAGYFRLQYPATWRLILGQAGGEGPAPDWTKESRPVDVMPPDALDPGAALSVVPFTPDEAKNLWLGWYGSSFDTVTQTTIDGHAAYYDKLDFVGPSSAEAYVDDNYLVLNDTQPLWLSFRENYRHNYPRKAWTNHDIAGLKAVASSIKILR